MKTFISSFLTAAVSSFFVAAAAAQQDPSLYFTGSGANTEAYDNWRQQADYEKTAFLQSKVDGFGTALHWTIDETSIRLAVAAQATGWVGFGLAESGSMRGADIVMFTAETNQLVDSHVLDQLVTPMLDDCQSWTLVNSVVEDGFIIFEATRLLDTGDLQDRAIINDSSILIPATRVIAAWGDSSAPSYHGINNSARSSVRFFAAVNATDEVEAFKRSMEIEAEGTFTIQAVDFPIPAIETHYEYTCFSRNDLLAMNVSIDQDLHTIGIEPVIDPRASKYVHHFIVTGSAEPWDSASDCEDDFPGIEIGYVWAPGDLPLSLPSNVGGPLGSSGFQSFMIETHYNNPWLDTGVLDSSGVRFHYTSNKRQYDMGVYQTGDPQIALFGQQVSPTGGLVNHEFECASGCSSSLVTEPVTVIREHLHMHATGVSMFNSQIRDGEVIREGGVQFWDFHQQGNLAVVQEPFDIQPGDSFRTSCNFDAKNGEEWGLGSSEEMCIAFLYYYPRQLKFGFVPFVCGLGFGDVIPECEASYSTSDLSDVSQIGRTFGTAPASCPGSTIQPTPAPVLVPDIPLGGKPSADPTSPPSGSVATTGASMSLVNGMAIIVCTLLALL